MRPGQALLRAVIASTATARTVISARPCRNTAARDQESTPMSLAAVEQPGPMTGLDQLRDALAEPRFANQHRAVFQVLSSANHRAAALYAKADNVLASLTLRADVPPDYPAYTRLARKRIAYETMLDLTRVLLTSPHTLAAIAKGGISPVFGPERDPLVSAVRRRLFLTGYTCDELAERRATYAAVDAIRDALAEPR